MNSEKSKYMLMSRKEAGQRHSIKIANRFSESVAKIQMFGNNTNRSKLHAGKY
jgi:hypothetical protein